MQRKKERSKERLQTLCVYETEEYMHVSVLFNVYLCVCFQALPYVCLLIAMLFFIYAIIGMQVSRDPLDQRKSECNDLVADAS